MLNSNDLFEQIGLIVSQQKEHSSSFDSNFSVFLEIELSEGKHELLQIRNYDDPHQMAVQFCRKNKLNSLAVEIVENKIKEAKWRQRNRLKQEGSPKMKRSLQKDSMSKEEKEFVKTRIAVRSKAAESKSISRSKSRYEKSPNKMLPKKSKANMREEQQTEYQGKVKEKNRNKDIGNQLYNRGMIKNKMQQTQRIKKREQRQKAEEKQLTFQPKINPISAKIVQFRKENPVDRQKQNKKIFLNGSRQSVQDKELQQCTFKPQINQVSNLILENADTYKDEYDHFTSLYRQAEKKQEKLNQKIIQSKHQMFQPKINPKSKHVVKQTFEERLHKSLLKKNQQNQQQQKGHNKHPFKPTISRGPKDNRHQRNQNSQLWQQLYQQKLKKTYTAASLSPQQNHPPTVSQTTNFYYQHLIDKRISEVFDALDGDEDGQISPENISVQNLTKNQLIFMRPIFQEMDQLQAVLDLTEFKRAVLTLLKESDPSVKGNFLMEKHKNQPEPSFAPSINQKSKQLVLSRTPTANSIYDQLYEQGLKELSKKEYRIQMCKARQEQQQLEECSFKPHLNNTSKYYIDKVLGKKISYRLGQNDEQLFF